MRVETQECRGGLELNVCAAPSFAIGGCDANGVEVPVAALVTPGGVDGHGVPFKVVEGYSFSAYPRGCLDEGAGAIEVPDILADGVQLLFVPGELFIHLDEAVFNFSHEAVEFAEELGGLALLVEYGVGFLTC